MSVSESDFKANVKPETIVNIGYHPIAPRLFLPLMLILILSTIIAFASLTTISALGDLTSNEDLKAIVSFTLLCSISVLATTMFALLNLRSRVTQNFRLAEKHSKEVAAWHENHETNEN